MGGGAAPDRSGDGASAGFPAFPTARAGDDAGAGFVVLDWHLENFGYRPTPAHIQARPRGRVRRALTAAAALVAGCTIAPVMILMPPHFDPAVITILVGAYLARVYWQGRFTARAFAGACPRCRSPLRLRRGALLRVPHAVHCRHCRRGKLSPSSWSPASGDWAPGQRPDPDAQPTRAPGQRPDPEPKS